jgi:hypothetical protein
LNSKTTGPEILSNPFGAIASNNPLSLVRVAIKSEGKSDSIKNSCFFDDAI